MNSWDVFDTLIARRCVDPFTDERDPQPEREELELMPIRENISRVAPDDLLVSDFYLPREWVVEQVRRVTGLENEVLVSRDGKATGLVWKRLAEEGRLPELHVGDNYTLDVEGPLAWGVQRTEHTTVSRPTEVERLYLDGPLPALGRCIREGRLRTFDPAHRQLELCQSQANFPVLVLATVGLGNWARANGVEKLLMSARDACLWVRLCHVLLPDLTSVYFRTSRVARVRGSRDYNEYVDFMVGSRNKVVALVDLCGTGWSMRRMLDKRARQGRRHDLLPWLFQKYDSQLAVDYESMAATDTSRVIGHMIPEVESACLEKANYARHPMVVDVRAFERAVYLRSGFDWADDPRIAAMHRSFAACLAATACYDLSEAFALPEAELTRMAATACRELSLYATELSFCDSDKKNEESIVMGMLHQCS